MEHRPPRFTTGMKTCLIALFEAVKENLYWIILAIAFALMLWLAPKVNATPLDDFIKTHDLVFPEVIKKQMEEQNLVAAAGMMNEKEQVFTIYFLPKTDLPSNVFQFIDFDKAVMIAKFYLVKKKVVVEYTTYKNCPQSAKIWPNNHREKVYVFLELWEL